MIFIAGGIGTDSNDFWCSKDSTLIHPVGWSTHVGHRLHASSEYMNSCSERYEPQKANPNDCTVDMFTNMPPAVGVIILNNVMYYCLPVTSKVEG